MIDDIEARLATVTGLVRESRLLQARHAELTARYADRAAEVADLHARYAGEVRDVDRLESLSLSRVLTALRGAHAEELSRERAEADAARYRLAEAQARLAAIGAEQRSVADRLGALADLPARHAAVLEEKDRHLRATDDPRAGRLLHLAEQRGRAEADLRELAEAAGAADLALRALGDVRRRLTDLRSYQTADNLLGGALVLGNPRWLDGVAWSAAHADRYLALLHTELTDVGLSRPLGPAQSAVASIGLTRGLIETVFATTIIKDRIVQAQRNADHAAHLVAEVQREVAARTEAARSRWNATMHERHSLLAG